jgi:hypothetical protein
VNISGWTIGALLVVVLINTLFVAGLAVALFLINKRVDEALQRAEPLLAKATETLGKVEDTAVQLQAKVDHVLDKTTELVDLVSDRVDTTTAIAEEAVAEPLIGAASVVAGIQRGLRVYSERLKVDGVKGDGGHGGE